MSKRKKVVNKPLPSELGIAFRRLEDAADAILIAYAKNDGDRIGIVWDNLDAAFVLVKKALPGRYRALVRQIERENA
jgi:hypothetical protein